MLLLLSIKKGGYMMNYEQLTPSQKIKVLRDASNCIQEDLAKALGCTKSKISRVENGDGEYNDDDIIAAKQFFGVDKAPFTEKELMNFKQLLYKWRDLIKNRRLVEARERQNDLAAINKLPFEPDLSMLYRMFEIKLILMEAFAVKTNVALAEEKLLAEASLIEDATKENQHHYYYNMGSLYIYKADFKISLEYYLKAQGLEPYVFEKDISLYVNIAQCYSMLGKYALAISMYEEAYPLLDHNRSSAARTYIDSSLAINYVRINKVPRAKRLLDKCLSEELGIDNKFHLGVAYHNYGCACWKSKDYEEAISYFDRADEYFEEGNQLYIENAYWKVRCLIHLKKNYEARMLISKAKSYIEGNEHGLLILDSLSHLLTINDEVSLDFIEMKTIPYLVEKYEYSRVLDYCYVLEDKFTKRINKGYKKRLVVLKEIILKITAEMLFGEDMIFNEEKTAGHSLDSGLSD